MKVLDGLLERAAELEDLIFEAGFEVEDDVVDGVVSGGPEGKDVGGGEKIEISFVFDEKFDVGVVGEGDVSVVVSETLRSEKPGVVVGDQLIEGRGKPFEGVSEPIEVYAGKIRQVSGPKIAKPLLIGDQPLDVASDVPRVLAAISGVIEWDLVQH